MTLRESFWTARILNKWDEFRWVSQSRYSGVWNNRSFLADQKRFVDVFKHQTAAHKAMQGHDLQPSATRSSLVIARLMSQLQLVLTVVIVFDFGPFVVNLIRVLRDPGSRSAVFFHWGAGETPEPVAILKSRSHWGTWEAAHPFGWERSQLGAHLSSLNANTAGKTHLHICSFRFSSFSSFRSVTRGTRPQVRLQLRPTPSGSHVLLHPVQLVLLVVRVMHTETVVGGPHTL